MSTVKLNKPITQLRGSDMAILEQMETLPDNIIWIDMKNPEKSRSGKIVLPDSVINDLVRFTIDLVKQEHHQNSHHNKAS